MSLLSHTRSVLDSMRAMRNRLEIPSFAPYIDAILAYFARLMPSLPPLAQKIASLIIVLFCNALMAFVFALPIYGIWLFESNHADMPYWLGSVLGVLSLYTYLRIPKSHRFGFGFFVGIWWFWWVGLSFRFFELSALVPLIAVCVALVYGVVFWVLLFCECLPVRLVGLLIMHFITPFGFDWLVPQALLAYSYFGVDSLHFCLLVIAIYVFIVSIHARTSCVIGSRGKPLANLALGLVCVFGALDLRAFTSSNPPSFTTHIALSATQIPQSIKWNIQSVREIIAYHFVLIEDAIARGKSLIILPETAFPFPLSDSTAASIYEALRTYSLDITIIAGALHTQGKDTYNSAFVFSNGESRRIDKVILAPFGEYIPLPRFIKEPFDFVTQMEFRAGAGFGDMEALGERFRVAICYEATSSDLYEGYPEFVIAMSNNAWFYPSIEPSLQKMLLKYYARLYQTTILHSANMSESAIIVP